MSSNRKKSPLMHIPSSVSIEGLAALHGHISAQMVSGPKLSIRERLKLATQDSLNTPAPDSGMRLKYDTEVDDSWASLPVIAVHFYEHNPRKANNEAYAELKESIRVNGILQPLTVTKRPGEQHYILFAGGNTRLHAIRELWEETGDGKFRETRVIIKVWRGESAVLLAHMAENTQRNDMTFWDRANGTLAIKRQIEVERGTSLSYREFEAELKKFGMALNLQSISAYRFAIEKIPDVGPWLSGLAVRTIQPRLNLLLKLANHHDIEEPGFYAEVVSPATRKVADDIVADSATFGTDHFLSRCEENLAVRLELESRDVAKMLTALERFPNMTLEDLQRLCRPAQPSTQPGLHPVASPARMPLATPSQTGDAGGVGLAKYPPVNAPSVAPTASGEVMASTPSQDQDRIMLIIQSLVVASGLGSCYEAAPGMPLGYQMGFPKDGPLDLQEAAQSRQSAWWILAMASSQFDHDLCRVGLPEGGEWRTLILEESNQETLGGLELAIQHNIGGQGEFLPIPWLLNPSNPIAGLCLELLAVIRDQGAAS